jgi:FkbM family methyltransferase
MNLKIGEKTLKVTYGIASLAKLIKENYEVIANNETIVTLKSPQGVVISCRTTKSYDFIQLQEIFLDNVYQYDVAGKNVVDIGMNIGDSAIYFAKKGAKRVIGLEPDKESFDLAVKNIEDSKVADIVTPLNKAINTRNEDISLKVWDNFPGSNSLLEYDTKPLNSEFRIITVNGIKLEDVINMFDERQIGLLKMDCEGCEYNILNAVSKEYLSRISAIIMEY